MPKFHRNKSRNIEGRGDDEECGSADTLAEDATDWRTNGVGDTKTNHGVSYPLYSNLTIHIRLKRYLKKMPTIVFCHY